MYLVDVDDTDNNLPNLVPGVEFEILTLTFFHLHHLLPRFMFLQSLLRLILFYFDAGEM